MGLVKNKNFLNLGKVILAGLILFLLVRSSQLNFELFANIFHKPFLFVELIAIFLTMVLIGSYRWYLLNAAQNIPLGFKHTIKPTYIAAAFNALLPGAVGGDFVRCYYVFKIFPDRKSTILLTIFFDRVIGLMGVLATLCLIALTHITYLSQQRELFYLLSLTICFCLGVFGVFAALMIFPQQLGMHLWLQRRFPENRIALLLTKYLDTFSNYRVPKWTLLKCLTASVLVQCLLVTALLLIAKMLNLPAVAFSHYAIAVGITLLVSLIPITPGGVGVGEMAFANILLLLNPHSAIPFATIFLCYRLVSMLTYLPAVIFYLPGFKLLRKKDLEFESK